MVSNINITENIQIQPTNKHKRYSLVASSVYGKEYIPHFPDVVLAEEARKKSRLYLSEIDALTSLYPDEESLLIQKGIYDYRAPATLSIEYQSNGITNSLPVMYNDELLNRIAQNSNTSVIQNDDTAGVFQNMKSQLLENKDDLLTRLLHSTPAVTDPRIVVVLNKALESGSSKINFEQLYNMMHKYYKQWRAFYYHTSAHYQKDIAIKQKKL